MLRAPLRQLPGLRVGQGGAVERLAQPLPLLRVRPGGQGLPDRRAGSEVRAVGAPQGGARSRGVDARQRPAVRARGGSLQEVLRRDRRQAAGQRAGLLLRLQRLREGERHRQVQRLPQGLHQEVRQAAGGGRVRRAGVHEAGRDHRALEQEQDRGARRLQARARRVHPAQAAGGDAGGRLRRQGRLHDHGGEVQGLPEEGAEVRQQARPDQEDVRRLHRTRPRR